MPNFGGDHPCSAGRGGQCGALATLRDIATLPGKLWEPADCPLCSSRVPLAQAARPR